MPSSPTGLKVLLAKAPSPGSRGCRAVTWSPARLSQARLSRGREPGDLGSPEKLRSHDDGKVKLSGPAASGLLGFHTNQIKKPQRANAINEMLHKVPPPLPVSTPPGGEQYLLCVPHL